MGCALNLFALLVHTAGRLGDRGAVFVGARQLHTWTGLRERALRLASTLGAPGTRIAAEAGEIGEIVCRGDVVMAGY
jgi:fatty-acyl-CoA synthase